METEMAYINGNTYNDKVQTEILDPSLPSELVEEDKGKKEYLRLEKEDLAHGHAVVIDQAIDSYTVKGKSMFRMLPKHQKETRLSMSLPTYQVSVEPGDIKGVKSLWYNIVGYSNRELYICEGFIYLLHKYGKDYHVDDLWSLEDLFKVFYDHEYEKIRLVLRRGPIVENRDFKPTKPSDFLGRLRDELKKIGREMA